MIISRPVEYLRVEIAMYDANEFVRGRSTEDLEREWLPWNDRREPWRSDHRGWRVDWADYSDEGRRCTTRETLDICWCDVRVRSLPFSVGWDQSIDRSESEVMDVVEWDADLDSYDSREDQVPRIRDQPEDYWKVRHTARRSSCQSTHCQSSSPGNGLVIRRRL